MKRVGWHLDTDETGNRKMLQPKTHFHIADSPTVDDATERIKPMLDAKYEAVSLQEIADSCTHLSK